MTYAVEALQQVGAHASATGDDVARPRRSWSGAAVVALALAAATLRRRTD